MRDNKEIAKNLLANAERAMSIVGWGFTTDDVLCISTNGKGSEFIGDWKSLLRKVDETIASGGYVDELLNNLNVIFKDCTFMSCSEGVRNGVWVYDESTINRGVSRYVDRVCRASFWDDEDDPDGEGEPEDADDSIRTIKLWMRAALMYMMCDFANTKHADRWRGSGMKEDDLRYLEDPTFGEHNYIWGQVSTADSVLDDARRALALGATLHMRPKEFSLEGDGFTLNVDRFVPKKRGLIRLNVRGSVPAVADAA